MRSSQTSQQSSPTQFVESPAMESVLAVVVLLCCCMVETQTESEVDGLLRELTARVEKLESEYNGNVGHYLSLSLDLASLCVSEQCVQEQCVSVFLRACRNGVCRYSYGRVGTMCLCTHAWSMEVCVHHALSLFHSIIGKKCKSSGCQTIWLQTFDV